MKENYEIKVRSITPCAIYLPSTLNVFGLVTNKGYLNRVVYHSDNLIIHVAKPCLQAKHIIILGSGYSLSLDENHQITHHDPFMILPDMKKYDNDTVVFSIFYPFEAKGLEAAGKELANFINSYFKESNHITLIGHSKCGACFANATQWIKRKQLNVVTVSAPFYGTPVTDLENFSANLNWLVRKIYGIIFSDHKVDRDIAPNSSFIQQANYEGLLKFNHVNVVSNCPTSFTINPIDLFLRYLNESQQIDGDGIVPASSQRLSLTGTVSKEVLATHASSLDCGIKIAKELFLH